MEELIAPTCKHADELIAFLYGELSASESLTFQRHSHQCSSCSEELAAFSNIRKSVIDWRDETLGRIAAPARFANEVVDSAQRKPSAIAALREFFNLSPIWLKGAVAFATLLFCLLAGLAVARLQNTAPTTFAVNNSQNSDNKSYSEQQLNALVERRVQDELQRIRSSAPQQAVADDSSNSVVIKRASSRRSEVAMNSPARRPLSKVERDQLAADLRLVAANSDSDLDLLDDRINQ